MTNKNEVKLFLCLAAGALVTAVGAVMNNNAGRAANPQPTASATAETAPVAAAAEAIPVLVAEQGTGIVVTKASDWAEQYPNEFNSYAKNDENIHTSQHCTVVMDLRFSMKVPAAIPSL